MIDEKLLEFCTPRQREYLEAWRKHGSSRRAAKALGANDGTVRRALVSAKRRAARHGHAPEHDMTRTTPEGYHVRGVSTLYNSSGEVAAQWVKTQVDKDQQLRALMDAIETIADPFRGTSSRPKAPKSTDADRLCVYPMGDPHLGMYAWAAETGSDFNLDIAEANLVAAVDHLVELAPPAREALIINLGDFFHGDNLSNTTARSGNALDVDTRWAKVLSVGVRTMRRLIDKALEKHAKVRVICEIGNHDTHSALMLAIALEQYYERDKRVVIDTSPATFHWYRFGSNLIGVTHGHNTKPQDLPLIMAADRPDDWGATQHRYWYTGHVHHDSVKEYGGVLVETFRTLAPKDAWHASKGYRAGQDMKLDVLHRDHGRVARHIVGIDHLKGAK